MVVLGGAWVCGASGAAPEGFPVAQILDHRSGFTGSFPSSVVVDREGRIWVSSDLMGLFVGDGLRFLKVELPQALAGRSVSAVVADLSGRMGSSAILPARWWSWPPAVPCGLILNELISNALKHAFPAGRKGVLTIRLRRRKDGAVELRIADNGVGFPEGLDFRRTESLGLQIVSLLVGQLEGTIKLDGKNGTAFTVAFHEMKQGLRIGAG